MLKILLHHIASVLHHMSNLLPNGDVLSIYFYEQCFTFNISKLFRKLAMYFITNKEHQPCILEQIKNTNHLTTWELKPSHSIIKQQTHFLLRLDRYYFFHLIDTIELKS